MDAAAVNTQGNTNMKNTNKKSTSTLATRTAVLKKAAAELERGLSELKKETDGRTDVTKFVVTGNPADIPAGVDFDLIPVETNIANTLMHVNDKALAKMESFIQDELLRRGFTAKIQLTQRIHENRNNGTSKLVFEITSEKFNTVPVIFRSLEINAFGQGIDWAQNDDESKRDDVLQIWIGVHVSTETFGGGGNGVGLFDCWFKVWAKNNAATAVRWSDEMMFESIFDERIRSSSR